MGYFYALTGAVPGKRQLITTLEKPRRSRKIRHIWRNEILPKRMATLNVSPTGSSTHGKIETALYIRDIKSGAHYGERQVPRSGANPPNKPSFEAASTRYFDLPVE